jgi:hypothetical protein
MSAALFPTWLEPVLCPATRMDPSSVGTSPKTALLSHKVSHFYKTERFNKDLFTVINTREKVGYDYVHDFLAK